MRMRAIADKEFEGFNSASISLINSAPRYPSKALARQIVLRPFQEVLMLTLHPRVGSRIYRRVVLITIAVVALCVSLQGQRRFVDSERESHQLGKLEPALHGVVLRDSTSGDAVPVIVQFKGSGIYPDEMAGSPEVQQENEDFAQKYVEVAQQNEGLANLYVASFQLHSTLDPEEVMGIVKEIIINLVGSEEFVLFVKDKRTGELSPVAWEGPFARREGKPAPWDAELLDRVARTGQPFFAPAGERRPGTPLACVPLTIKQEVVGVIAVFRLLVQKPALGAMDMEIMNLLAAPAATAIVSSRLYADADRKLKTIEGFMELLKAR